MKVDAGTTYAPRIWTRASLFTIGIQDYSTTTAPRHPTRTLEKTPRRARSQFCCCVASLFGSCDKNGYMIRRWLESFLMWGFYGAQQPRFHETIDAHRNV